MNLVSLRELVEYSRENRVGIGMFNIVNLEFARAIFEASQETGIPAIFGIPERFFQYYSADVMVQACRTMLQDAKVPMAIHLDHGKHFEGVMTALRAGFSSVMFDGSALSYEENVAQTAEIVKIAHAMGVSVEGELGYVGRSGVDEVSSDGFTKPEQAEDFVARTKVDALAIAIGNQHGQYKSVPKLDFNRLCDIRARVECGLVLHGGSGIQDQDFVKAIKCGINKVNIYTAMDVAAREFNAKHFGDYGAYLDYTRDLTSIVKDVVKKHIILFATK